MIAYVLLGIGLLLIFLEFFLPGGIAAALGIVLLIFSVALFAMTSESLIAVVLYILAIAFVVGCLMRFALWRIKTGRAGENMYLDSDQEGYVASKFAKEFIGKKGVALSDLKPAGHIKVEGKRMQAVSKTGYLVKGTKIEVIGGQGAHLIVKIIVEDQTK